MIQRNWYADAKTVTVYWWVLDGHLNLLKSGHLAVLCNIGRTEQVCLFMHLRAIAEKVLTEMASLPMKLFFKRKIAIDTSCQESNWTMLYLY